jgi:hypothetical protein
MLADWIRDGFELATNLDANSCLMGPSSPSVIKAPPNRYSKVFSIAIQASEPDASAGTERAPQRRTSAYLLLSKPIFSFQETERRFKLPRWLLRIAFLLRLARNQTFRTNMLLASIGYM